MNTIIFLGTIGHLALATICYKYSKKTTNGQSIAFFWVGMFIYGTVVMRLLSQTGIIDITQNRVGNSILAVGSTLIILLDLYKAKI